MKRTALMIAAGITALMTLGSTIPASADLLYGMPSTNTMGMYNQIMRQYGGYAQPRFGTGLTMGMPRTNIMQDYRTLLPRLQALQAWGHAHGMPYALPGTLGGYSGGGMNGATSYWGDKWDKEFLREDTPIYENNGGHFTQYSNGDTATEW